MSWKTEQEKSLPLNRKKEKRMKRSEDSLSENLTVYCTDKMPTYVLTYQVCVHKPYFLSATIGKLWVCIQGQPLHCAWISSPLDFFFFFNEESYTLFFNMYMICVIKVYLSTNTFFAYKIAVISSSNTSWPRKAELSRLLQPGALLPLFFPVDVHMCMVVRAPSPACLSLSLSHGGFLGRGRGDLGEDLG